jgi:NitT/TauT family transport system permease protein
LLWEILGQFVVTNRLFFAPISSVLKSLFQFFGAGQIYFHLYVSFAEFFVGLFLAIIVGIPIGLLMGVNKLMYDYLDVWVAALYATPLVALTPFFVMIFGIGIESKAALVFTLCVFPVVINTTAGVKSVDPTYLEVARSFDANALQIFRKVLMPGCLPFIISGIRLASGRGLTAVVVGELFFSSAGVGHLISLASQTFNSASLFAGVVIFAGAGMLFNRGLQLLEERLAPWRGPI